MAVRVQQAGSAAFVAGEQQRLAYAERQLYQQDQAT
jgi:hypothetical protein